MQGIMAWLRAHPDEGRAIMRENKSFVFFRELSGPPEGAMGLPVTGGATVAVDPKFVPMGAPVLLSMDRADANGIRSEEHTSELQSLMRISYAVFCLKKKKKKKVSTLHHTNTRS